jgi:hypothetical protein
VFSNTTGASPSPAISFGSTLVSAKGGSYRLCWCASAAYPSPCLLPSGHRVDVGRLTVVGPTYAAERALFVSGIVAGVVTSKTVRCQGLNGPHDALIAGRFAYILFSATNLTARGVPLATGSAVHFVCVVHDGVAWSYDTGSYYGEFVLSTDDVLVARVDFLHQHIAVLTGRVQPPLADNATNESAFDAFVGVAHSTVHKGYHHGDLAIVSQSWGSYTNQSIFEFTGSYLTIGISSNNDRTCVSGQRCNFHGIRGQDLSDEDSMILLDTCGLLGKSRGAAVITPGLAWAPWSITSTSDPDVGITASAATVTLAGGGYVVGQGGEYRVCWCAAGFLCNDAADFQVTVGQLLLLGPMPFDQDRTCVSGQTCALEGFLGVGLASADAFMVLDTCANSDVMPRYPQTGALMTASSGAATTWGSDVVTAQGGIYRLCWCAAGFACDRPEHAVVDIGRLLLLGPSPLKQHQTCISGVTCMFESITGVGLAASSQLAVLETCGVGTRINASNTSAPFAEMLLGMPRGGLPQHLLLGLNMTSHGQAHSQTQGDRYTFGMAPLTVIGGEYRLCWCIGTPFSCSISIDFRTDMGAFHLLGPAPHLQDRTCVAGQTCWVQGLTGYALGADDQWLVLDTCGVIGTTQTARASPPIHATSSSGASLLWEEPLALHGGEYRLCWCKGVSNASTINATSSSLVISARPDNQCFLPAQYITDVGLSRSLGRRRGREVRRALRVERVPSHEFLATCSRPTTPSCCSTHARFLVRSREYRRLDMESCRRAVAV